jgi:hypothetical protein
LLPPRWSAPALLGGNGSAFADDLRRALTARPPYSAALVATLTARLGLDGSGRMLDVGSRPGILALAFADQFAEVVAIDPDSDMLAEGARLASATGKHKSSRSVSPFTGPTGCRLPRLSMPSHGQAVRLPSSATPPPIGRRRTGPACHGFRWQRSTMC